MAKISDMAGNQNGNYAYLMGDKKRGHLLSQSHAAMIRAGAELQDYINKSIPKNFINELAKIFQGQNINTVREIVLKPKMPKSGEKFGIEIILLDKRVNFKMPNKGWDGGGAQFPVAWYTWGFGIGYQLTFAQLEQR